MPTPTPKDAHGRNPDGYEDLLQRPLYGHLATTRPNGSVQVNPMWFDWDGELLRFTHTSKRQKYRRVVIVVRPTGVSKR